MRKLFTLYALLLISGYTFAQEKVYYVGHSLVNLDIPYMVQQIVSNAGNSNDYRHHINIGTGLKANWMDTAYNGNEIWNPELMMNIEYGSNHLTELLQPYDHIVITEAVPMLVSNRDTSIKYGANFYNLVRTNTPACKKYLYATWEDDAHHLTTWKPLVQSLITEWEVIEDGLAAASGGDSVHIVPGNIALLSLADSISGGGFGSMSSLSEFFNPDGIHLNNDGNYFIACLMAAVVYHVNAVGQPPVHAGPYRPLSDSTIMNEVNRFKIQELAVSVACHYSRTGAQSLCRTVGLPPITSDKDGIKMYPNPVQNGVLFIESNMEQSFILSSISGQQLLKTQLQKGQNSIDLSHISAGLYFIQTNNNTSKIIIQ